MSESAIRKIIIVGGGSAGWMAAAVLSRSLGSSVQIDLVESEAIGTVGVGEATIPPIRLINQYLGLNEHDFLRQTGGTIKLGIAFNGWNGNGSRYLHAFGEIGQTHGLVPFHHLWLRGRREGMAHDLWSYSLNSAAATEARFGALAPAQSRVPGGLLHAYHFDARCYATTLRSLAGARGVNRHEGRVAEVVQDSENGFIRELLLADGRRLSADFFVDCSGFRGLLIEQTLAAGYEDWREWLPCDRAIAVPCEHRSQQLAPITEATARKAGWQWRIPLQHRVGNGYVHCSEHISEDEATAQLLASLEGKALAEPRTLHFTPGRRRQCWQGNCVAIGLASGFLEPLESTSIHLIQTAISRLLRHFPNRHCDPALRASYNRQTRDELESIRDFLILHYQANARHGEAFWDARRVRGMPDSLAERVAAFRAGGVLTRQGDELFTEGSWLQVLLGQGIEPRHHSRLADAMDSAELQRFLNGLRQAVRRTAQTLPSHRNYLREYAWSAQHAA